MDWSTLLGFGLAGLLVVAALLVAQVPVGILLHPAGWLLVLGGTAIAVQLSFATPIMKEAIKRAGESFQKRDEDPLSAIEQLVDIAAHIRKQGALSLMPYLPEWQRSEPWLAQGLTMVLDNTPNHRVQDRLTTELDLSYRNALEACRVFEAAAGYAPTMGLLGALVGLMHTLSHLDSPELLGQGVASAFSATLLGLGLANLVLLPLSTKLKHQARQEWLRGSLIIQGVLGIQLNEHPVVLRERLMALLRQTGLQQSVPAPNPQQRPQRQVQEPCPSLPITPSMNGRPQQAPPQAGTSKRSQLEATILSDLGHIQQNMQKPRR